ncbi:MAG: hypothetical protein WBA12_06245 [Catalinimonas sp.]
MKKDIDFPTVAGVQLAVTREQNEEGAYDWRVHLINQNEHPLDTVLVTSKGYSGPPDAEDPPKEGQRTSTLRHLIEYVEPKSTAVIERIDPEVFHLVNEYWVSYYVEGRIHDKKFLFVPDSIVDEHLQFIPALELEGVLHI